MKTMKNATRKTVKKATRETIRRYVDGELPIMYRVLLMVYREPNHKRRQIISGVTP